MDCPDLFWSVVMAWAGGTLIGWAFKATYDDRRKS